MKTIFFRLIEATDKAADLLTAIREPTALSGQRRFEIDPEEFATIPRSPFAYWASEQMRNLFKSCQPFESSGRAARVGVATLDNFRFLRLQWEIRPPFDSQGWCPYAKGGAFSPFYDSIDLVVNWFGDGHELKCYVEQTVGSASRKIQAPEFYFRPGITWPSRTQSGFAPRVLPRGCVFDTKGNSAFVPGDDPRDLLSFLALFLSSTFRSLVNLQMSFGAYEVGVVQRTPIPSIDEDACGRLSALARRGWLLKRALDTRTETSLAFTLPSLLQSGGPTLAERAAQWRAHLEVVEHELASIRAEIDEQAFDLYRITLNDRRVISSGLDNASAATEEGEGEVDGSGSADQGDDGVEGLDDSAGLVAGLVSWLVGVAFGRFDIRVTAHRAPLLGEPEPFDHLHGASPGMLVGADGLPADSGRIVSQGAGANTKGRHFEASVGHLTVPDAEYPITVNWDGVLVDDSSSGAVRHRNDIGLYLSQMFEILWKESAHEIEREACDLLGVTNLHDYLRKPAGFFSDHLRRYSKSRRKAPIYWPLSTESGSYTLWVYYQRLTDQTLFSCVNDYLDPRIADIDRDLDRVNRADQIDREARRERDDLLELQGQLRSMRSQMLDIARLPYKPNLNDGVVINAAPLWPLFRYKPWQNELRKCWDALKSGDFDWSHMAKNIWPERVSEACRKDKSIAIAHGLQNLYEDKGIKKARGKRR